MTTSTNEKTIILSYYTLRQTIGWLGVLLPIALLVGNYGISLFSDFENGCSPFKSSISHYFYTRVSELFTGTMCAVAVFLFSYNGYKNEKVCFSDKLLTDVAAIAAIIVVLFPTSPGKCSPIECNLRCYYSSESMGAVHFISAAVFFLSLAWLSGFNFRKTDDEKTKKKKARNKIYGGCAITMVACIILIALYSFVICKKTDALAFLCPVFSLETLALFAFGFSWLTKGEFILEDPETKEKKKLWKKRKNK